jgi:hypothetical protein
MTDSPLRVLSLGAGVQSTTTLLLAEEGRIESFDRIIFADTQDEPQSVYEHLARLMDRFPAIEVVTAGKLSDTFATDFTPVPFFTADGGMGQRQCTNQYKLRPIRQHLRRQGAKAVEMAVCISMDETWRMKDSGLKWCRNYWPLVDLGWHRKTCEVYLEAHWPYPVPRSACTYCPFKSDAEWWDMRENHPEDWLAAVEMDRAARKHGYAHRSCVPLDEAVLRPEDAGQMVLECEGMCGV